MQIGFLMRWLIDIIGNHFDQDCYIIENLSQGFILQIFFLGIIGKFLNCQSIYKFINIQVYIRAVPEKKMRGSLTACTIFSSELLGLFVFKSCGLWE